MIKIGAQQGQENVVNDELYICICHQLAPGVGPWANQGENDGFSRGWVGLSASRHYFKV